MSEAGVNIINGTDKNNRSRSGSPFSKESGIEDKPKKFLNGWSREQERLMADWSDIASSYRWLHDQSEKIYHTKTIWINLPVIILSTLGGTANFGIQSLFAGDENALKYASFAIGGVSLFAGLLTTVGNYLRYAQLEESHSVASISWGKFQRLLAVELALNPIDRMDSLDFLKICRADLDRLIEQSPPIPKEAIGSFENKFGSIKELKKPDICGALEHTTIFQSSETRLKQAATDAALMLRRKKQTLSELVTPEMEKKIATQIEIRLTEALETRKNKLEEEIKLKRMDEIKTQEEIMKAIDERKKKIEEEIELEKKRVLENHINQKKSNIKTSGSNFESRLTYKKCNGIQISDKFKQNLVITNIPKIAENTEENRDKLISDTFEVSIIEENTQQSPYDNI
jgi:hypothetical protein